MTTWVLAVDLGGTKVEAALIDENGVLLPQSRFRAATGRLASSAELEASVRSVVTQARAALPDAEPIVGVGIGTAGPITVSSGLVSPLNLPNWRDYPLRTLIATLVPECPVELRMDGECITLAEHWVGAAQGKDNIMGMVVSTGVGGGLILGGRAIAGPTGNAGHIGHLEIGGFDTPCLCGGIGCLEAIAAGPHTTTWARAQGWSGNSGEDLAVSYSDRDPIAIAAVHRSATAVGQAIAAATALVDLELVAIGGGFSRVASDYFDIVRAAIARRAPFPFVTKVRVVASGLSGDGPLIGAAALIHRAGYRS